MYKTCDSELRERMKLGEVTNDCDYMRVGWFALSGLKRWRERRF